MTSCEEPEPAVVAELPVKTSQVTAKGGSMFVNVTCNGTWELSLKGQDAAIDWTELSPTSGTGNKANVILRYDDNTSGQAGGSGSGELFGVVVTPSVFGQESA